MSRTTEKSLINKEDVKARWEEIYRSRVKLERRNGKYVGLCPFHSERTPSFNVFEGGSYNCFGCGKNGGDVIQFIMELDGKTFVEALNILKDGFNITSKAPRGARKPIAREPILYEFNSMPFTREHHLYWNKYYLSEDFVTSEGDIYAIKAWAINKKKQEFTEGEIAFGYIFKDENGKEDGIKILRLGPHITKMDKWRTNVSNTRIWYLYKYKGVDIPKLFIAKSNKDALVTLYHGIPSVATQSENDKVLAKNIPMLQEYCPHLVLNFGSDEQGTNASINVSKEFNLPWFNTPKSYLKHGINDNAEYQAEFGPRAFRELLKNKNYL